MVNRLILAGLYRGCGLGSKDGHISSRNWNSGAACLNACLPPCSSVQWGANANIISAHIGISVADIFGNRVGRTKLSLSAKVDETISNGPLSKTTARPRNDGRVTIIKSDQLDGDWRPFPMPMDSRALDILSTFRQGHKLPPNNECGDYQCTSFPILFRNVSD